MGKSQAYISALQ